MLNSLRPKCLLVDTATHKFISEYFPEALAAVSATKTFGKITLAGRTLAPSQQSSANVFSFKDLDTPNIREKVIWVPQTHTWKLLLTKPPKNTDPLCDQKGRPLSVDPKLGAEEYKIAKKDMYERAKHSWNELDGSKRPRISIAVPLPTPSMSGSQSGELADSETQSGFGGMSQRWDDDEFM